MSEEIESLKKEKAELEKEIERYRDLVEYLPDIVQSVDAEGSIIFVNKKATEILGYSKEELLRMKIDDLYEPELWKDVGRGFQKLIREGAVFRVKTTVLAKNGKSIEIEVSSTACYDEKGNFLGTRSILRDIQGEGDKK